MYSLFFSLYTLFCSFSLRVSIPRSSEQRCSLLYYMLACASMSRQISLLLSRSATPWCRLREQVVSRIDGKKSFASQTWYRELMQTGSRSGRVLRYRIDLKRRRRRSWHRRIPCSCANASIVSFPLGRGDARAKRKARKERQSKRKTERER